MSSCEFCEISRTPISYGYFRTTTYKCLFDKTACLTKQFFLHDKENVLFDQKSWLSLKVFYDRNQFILDNAIIKWPFHITFLGP